MIHPGRTSALLIIIALCLTVVFTQAQESGNTDIHIRVPVENQAQVEQLIQLGMQIEANIVKNFMAEGFVSTESLENIKSAGFEIVFTDDPQLEDKFVTDGLYKDHYYTYEEVKSSLDQWEEQLPDMAKVELAGKSLQGKNIWLLRLTGAPEDSPRQRIFISGSCHGNEKIGTECAMRIAKHLMDNYDSDPQITEIMNRSEIMILPIVNVDGFPDRRTLSNGKDPNRCYGFQVGGEGEGRPYAYPEMQIHRNLLIEGPWYFSLDFHSGIRTLLQPWFSGVTNRPDDAEFKKLASVYQVHNTVDDLKNSDIIRLGGQGIACDGAYGTSGTLSMLPEVYGDGYNPPANGIENVTDINLSSFLASIKEIQKGLKGSVRCAQTDMPLYARITVKDQGVPVFTYNKSGAYFKYISNPSGSYQVTAFVNGYESETKTVQIDYSNGFTELNFELEPVPSDKHAALSVLAIQTSNEMSINDILSCLEKNDGNGTPLDGVIVLDMGPAPSSIINIQGNDLTVHCTNNGSYTVYAASDIDLLDSEQSKIGDGQGTQSFDLETIGLNTARYIQIKTSSAVIDAVEGEGENDPDPDPDEVVEIKNGQIVTDISEKKDQWKYYKVRLPEGAANLEIKITGGSGDADLYTRFGEKPIDSDYDCRPYRVGNNETCSEPVTSQGWYFIGLFGWDDFSGISLSVIFDEQDSDPRYCKADGVSQLYEYIKNISIGPFSNPSASSGYSNFTSLIINMNAGSDYRIGLTPGFIDKSYNEYWRIWIDLNSDGDFEDLGEMVFEDSGNSELTGIVTVPESAIAGNTRMRISMKYNGHVDSCGTFPSGEVEDYTVSIK